MDKRTDGWTEGKTDRRETRTRQDLAHGYFYYFFAVANLFKQYFFVIVVDKLNLKSSLPLAEQ
jgi:hypothetical protein